MENVKYEKKKKKIHIFSFELNATISIFQKLERTNILPIKKELAKPYLDFVRSAKISKTSKIGKKDKIL